MTTLLEIGLRCALVYIYLLILLRLAGKRTVAENTPFDFIVALILSDLPSAVYWGEIPVVQGLVAMTTLMLLHILVTLGVAHVPLVNRIVESLPTPLIAAGQQLPDKLRFERVTRMQLDELLREAKIDSQDQVQEARLEPSGILTVTRTAEAEFARKRDLPH